MDKRNELALALYRRVRECPDRAWDELGEGTQGFWLDVADAAIARMGQQRERPSHVRVGTAVLPVAGLYYNPSSTMSAHTPSRPTIVLSSFGGPLMVTVEYDTPAARDAALAALDRATGVQSEGGN